MHEICKWCSRTLVTIKTVWLVCTECDASPMTGDGPWTHQGDTHG